MPFFKIGLVLFVILLISSCNSSCSSESDDSFNEMGLHYSFDGEGAIIKDQNSNGYDATAESVSRVDGKIGKGIKFLNLGAIVDIPHREVDFSNGITFMSWIRTDHQIAEREQIFGGWTGGNSDYPVTNFGISIIDDKISFEVPAQEGVTTIETEPIGFNPDEWYHLAITYNGDSLKIFLNGEIIDESSIITTFSLYLANQLGQNYRVWGGVTVYDQYYGSLDEVYLYFKVLDDAEIVQYYNENK